MLALTKSFTIKQSLMEKSGCKMNEEKTALYQLFQWSTDKNFLKKNKPESHARLLRLTSFPEESEYNLSDNIWKDELISLPQ